MKERIVLVLFGSFVGLLGALGAYYFLSPSRDGVEFESVEGFRTALKDPRAAGKYRRPDGSLPFVAVIEENPSDDIIYTLRPNLHDNFTGVLVDTNSFGMRSPERPIAKPAGVYRIALMGDSFAFGWGVAQKEGFAQVIEDLLNQRFKGAPLVEVLNFGIPGYSTFQEVALFKERAVSFRPDAVLFFLVDNDFDFPFFIRDSSKGNALVRSISLGAFGGAEYKRAQKELLVGRDPISSFLKLDEMAREQGVKAFLAVNPRKNWRVIMRRLEALRGKTQIRFIDFGESFEDIVKEKGYTDADLNLPDDPHPTALRHRIYGELIAQDLAQYVP